MLRLTLPGRRRRARRTAQAAHPASTPAPPATVAPTAPRPLPPRPQHRPAATGHQPSETTDDTTARRIHRLFELMDRTQSG